MTERILDDETRYVLLRRLADNPDLSQRELGMASTLERACRFTERMHTDYASIREYATTRLGAGFVNGRFQ